jgi:hypothetical protein
MSESFDLEAVKARIVASRIYIDPSFCMHHQLEYVDLPNAVHEVERLCEENKRLKITLDRIVSLGHEWNANRLGCVTLQRKRWERLARIAADALVMEEETRETP